MDEEYVIVSHGHRAVTPDDGKSWRWEDTGEPINFESEESFSRPCPRCGRMPTADGHDACIADLPGVEEACCGHSQDFPYIAFKDESVFRKVVDFLYSLNKSEDEPKI